MTEIAQEITVVERPYKEIQVREFTKFQLEDFLTLVTSADGAIITHCNGVCIRYIRDTTKFGVDLRKDDILVLSSVEYCILPYKPIITSNTNIKVAMIQDNDCVTKALAKMALKKEMNHE